MKTRCAWHRRRNAVVVGLSGRGYCREYWPAGALYPINFDATIWLAA